MARAEEVLSQVIDVEFDEAGAILELLMQYTVWMWNVRVIVGDMAVQDVRQDQGGGPVSLGSLARSASDAGSKCIGGIPTMRVLTSVGKSRAMEAVVGLAT
jgi:hypothetical protein